ncbi:F0F1 ATP synthase subunit B [Planobispora longispora]|uniref:ATP synthase subunit b n=1 Tax=Planobispora longispora TaxID=28887 RepID=A0A8J3RJG3_9ACTN|nr:F0F1 ATP synthase subunit B [Planobispora longispora]BFE87147.1 F0F1 ATP synthase subunit B [Planobispora longispora]GIH74769.1 ATP synthase subunit b [Planobispora longispora]
MILTAVAAAESNPLLPHPAEMAIGGFAFLLVLFFVGKLLVPRIQKTLEERTAAIEGGIQKAQDAQAEAQAMLAQYKEQLAEARHEASRLREEAREQGAQIKAELREEAQAEARRLIEAAHAQIEADRQQAFAQLRAEIGRLSTDLAGRIVGESLEDEARQRRTVDRFLEELESSSAAVR